MTPPDSRTATTAPPSPLDRAREARTRPHAGAGARHLRHVDGLRAVAVGLVVAYHAGVPVVSGGYVGVDVFFVISGFLITGLLLRELETTGRVDLLRFYARRARRLLPAAAVVVLACAAAGAVLLVPLQRRALAVDLAAASTFVANWRFASLSTDYSAAAVEQSPVLHFWSLAVEEQYYLLWPLLMLLTGLVARRAGLGLRPAVGLVLVVALGSSLVVSVVATAATGTTAYFGLHTRAWELAAGGLLALAVPYLPRIAPRLRRPAGVLGLVMITLSAVVYTAETPFPGYAAVLPVLGTVLVVALGTGSRLLESRLVVGVGQLSYSWYLWHWPVLFFAGVALGDPAAAQRGQPWGLTAAVIALAVLASFVLAVVSYLAVEQPVRMAGPLVRRRALSLLLGAALVASGLGASVALATTGAGPQQVRVGVEDGALVPGRGGSAPMTAEEAAADYLDMGGCHQGLREVRFAPEPCLWGDEAGQTRVLLVGDSHAHHWLPALDRIGQERGWRVTAQVRGSCPLADVTVWLERGNRTYDECDQWREQVLGRAAEDGPYDLVVTARARTYADLLVVDGERIEDQEAAAVEWEAATVRLLAGLDGVAERVVILESSPYPGMSAPRCLSKASGDASLCTYPREGAVDTDEHLAVAERRAAAGAPVPTEVVETSDMFCEQPTCGTVTTTGTIVFRDTQHVTRTYALSLADDLAARLTSPPG